MSLRFLRKLSVGLMSVALISLCQFSMASEAQKPKTLHVLFANAEASLDPVVASDIESLSVNENIFDAMLRYDYLARPVKLVVNTLRAMPVISDGGKTILCQIQPGFFFSEDASFQGKKRELTAQDYVYSIKRHYDPTLKSPWLFLFNHKLLGDEKLHTKNASGLAQFDIDTPIEGLQVLDRYTLQIRLKVADPQFLFQLAMPASAAVAREVVEHYGDQIGNHPVGTGPFMMGQWQRSFKMELLANPHYRKVIFASSAVMDDKNRAVFTALRDKRLPQLDRIEIKIVEEQQSRVLGFLNREFDYLEQLPPPLSNMVLKQMAPKPELKTALKQRGIQLALFSNLQTYYTWMNMEDPVLGGYTPEKIALRRAIALSYNSQEDIVLMEKGLAIPAQSPLPPNVLGYDASYRSPNGYDVRLANALLDRFGYRRDADGYRNLPNGQKFTLLMHSLASTTGRLRDESWRKNLNAIGVRIQFKNDKKAEIIKAARLGKVQMAEANWIADFPDGSNFYQLLYGPNRGLANYARFNLPEFNALYERAISMPDDTEKQAVYHDMAQLMHAYNPWVVRTHPLSADLWHPWLKNYYRHPVEFTGWRYLDIQH